MIRDLLLISAAFALLSLGYGAAVAWWVGAPALPLDDAFIHLQFARNLAEAGQMAFNRGEPSSGCTAPLYPALIAGVHAVVRDWRAASYALGALTALGAALSVYAIVRQWTQQRELARGAGLLAAVASPTIIAAYSGMESPVYTLVMLLGLLAYGGGGGGGRLAGSAVLALGVWLRPEFVLFLPLIVLERFWATWVERPGRWAAWMRTCVLHGAIWAGVVVLYMAYHWRQDGHLVPSTFHAKAVAGLVFAPPWLKGLPAALRAGDALAVMLSVAAWPALILASANAGLIAVCPPLMIGMKTSAEAASADRSATASAKRLALLTLYLYPLLRGMVDPLSPFWYQFQRYYAHLTPLMIVLAVGMLPRSGAMVDWFWWSWRGVAPAVQVRRALLWCAPALAAWGALSVLAASNINDMQVALGRWLRAHTHAGALVAANDIGAIGFESERPILDTIGLVEPAIVEHTLAGGSLVEYLDRRRPEYVVVFPAWYPQIAADAARFEPVHRVRLDLNVICGADEMVVYRVVGE